MAETNLGRVAIVPKGTYSASVQYMYLDLVYYNGSSYLVHTQPTIGTLPTDTNYFYLAAQGAEVEMRYDSVTEYIQWKLITDVTWNNLIQLADFTPTIVQITGTSTTDVMSQKAVTDELALKAAHGYASSPKTLKQVDDSLVQLAGDVSRIIKSDLPFHREATFEGKGNLANSILDVRIEGGNPNWRIAFHTLNRQHSIYGHFIRLAVYDENDDIITTMGNNGLVAQWIKSSYIEPNAVNGKVVELLNFKDTGGLFWEGITNVKILIDWSELPAGDTNHGSASYDIGGLSSQVFEQTQVNDYVTTSEVHRNIPAAELKVWAKTNKFELGNLNEAILNCEIYGVSDKSKRYGIELLRYTPTGPARSFIAVREFLNDGTASTRVALWDNSLYTPPTSINGKQIDTLTLVPQNSSGITIIATVDWAKLPLSGTQWTGVYWYSNAFKVTDGEFSYNAYKDGSVLSGSATVNFQIDGVNCRLITPDAYGQSDKTHLLILCHGNGQNYTYTGSASFMAFCKANNIAIATTTGQDKVSAPFTTNASGWGNYVHLQRYVKLYNYLVSRYNFHNSVIISGASMGGLIAGHLCYTKHIPIQFAVLAGPVPDLSYIFANGGTTRKSPIRNSYGMAADGSDDANLENFISGYDWFDMGLTEISGSKYKVGFPHIYINVGTGDTTFSVDFGGTAKYTEIVNAIRNAGGFIDYNEIAGVSHAANECFDKFITDGVFEKELGV